MPMIEEHIPLVEEILAPFGAEAPGVAGYRNHVYRLINFASGLDDLDEEAHTKITIAACFHDVGLFTDDTLDYLPPSIARARTYLTRAGLESWSSEITTMIDQHHKLRSVGGSESRLVELFRKADLIDFSLGVFRFDIPSERIREVKRAFPNVGFHKHLLNTAGRWICRHPLNPLPILKW
jgi:hypothetical protein